MDRSCLTHCFRSLKPFLHYCLSYETGLELISWMVSKFITDIGRNLYVSYIKIKKCSDLCIAKVENLVKNNL